MRNVTNGQALPCSEIQKMFSPYLDGELSAGEQDVLSQHLAVCSSCAEELAQWQKLSASLRQLRGFEAAAPATLRQTVMAELRALKLSREIPGTAGAEQTATSANGRLLKGEPLKGSRRYARALQKLAVGVAAGSLVAAGIFAAFGINHWPRPASEIPKVAISQPVNQETSGDRNGSVTVSQRQEGFAGSKGTAGGNTAGASSNGQGDMASLNAFQTQVIPSAPSSGTSAVTGRPNEITGNDSGAATGDNGRNASSEGARTFVSEAHEMLSVNLHLTVHDVTSATEALKTISEAIGGTYAEYPFADGRLLIRAVIPAAGSNEFDARLSRMGTIEDKIVSREDFTARYNQTQAQLAELEGRLRAGNLTQDEKHDIETQIAALRHDLGEWDKMTGKAVFVIWLQPGKN